MLDNPDGGTVIFPMPWVEVDLPRLLDDYNRVANKGWSVNRYTPDATEWKTLALISPSGLSDDVRTAEHATTKPTELADLCPYIMNELLPQFGDQLLSVRLSRLGGGAVIGDHYDLIFNSDVTRIHVPIITNEHCVMRMLGKEFRMRAGEVWYFDASSRHGVDNSNGADRIHLLIDARLPRWFRVKMRNPSFSDHLRYAARRVERYLILPIAVAKAMLSLEGRKRIIAKLKGA